MKSWSLSVCVRSKPFLLSPERQVFMPGRPRMLQIHLDDQTRMTLQQWVLRPNVLCQIKWVIPRDTQRDTSKRAAKQKKDL